MRPERRPRRGATTQPRPPGRRSPRPAARRDGATQSHPRLQARLQSWLAHHHHTALDSLRRLLATPGASAMTWLVIGIALALPAALFVTLQNLEDVSRGWDGNAQLSLFLEQSVATEQGQQLAERVAEHPAVRSVHHLSADQALAEFRALSGFGDVLDSLDDNPLPGVLSIHLHDHAEAPEQAQQLAEELQALPEVDQVMLDLAWVQRLYGLMELGRRLTLALALALSLGVLLIIGNTIRLAIESRRDEVIIVKLVGGTDAFVRRPFLYTGLWYGLGGGVLAWFVVSLGVLWLKPASSRLAALYDSGYSLSGLGLGNALALWVTGALLGWLGAWLAVNRHLHDIEPS